MPGAAPVRTCSGSVTRRGKLKLAQSPRIVWVVRVPGDTLGNCPRIDARKFNKNTPGLEFKLLTGKCEMYQREKLEVVDG